MLSIGGISFITVHQIAIKWLVIENCKSDSALSLIHGTRQSVATGIGYQMLDVNMSKMSRCQSVTFQYDMRDAICFK